MITKNSNKMTMTTTTIEMVVLPCCRGFGVTSEPAKSQTIRDLSSLHHRLQESGCLEKIQMKWNKEQVYLQPSTRHMCLCERCVGNTKEGIVVLEWKKLGMETMCKGARVETIGDGGHV